MKKECDSGQSTTIKLYSAVNKMPNMYTLCVSEDLTNKLLIIQYVKNCRFFKIP